MAANAGKKTSYPFDPGFVVPPGETLRETLEVLGMTQTELARRTGLTSKTINGIIKGKEPITPDTALALERVLGTPASFWNNLERNYRERLARIQERERLAQHISWATKFPLKELVKRGVIPKLNDNVEQFVKLLDFFGVSSPEAWREVWLNPKAAFRSSPAFESKPEALATWLRLGELQALKLECAPYDERKFKQALKEIRNLTRESPEVFHPRMEELCASAGVALVFVPELPGITVSGASRWLSPRRALIQLNLRYKRNDQLWFSFFHEACHILKHSKKEGYISIENNHDPREEEANHFAADFLIPPAAYRAFCARHPSGRISRTAVENFAQQLGIHPGIVVGRLQHDRIIPYSYLNGLYQRLKWAKAA